MRASIFGIIGLCAALVLVLFLAACGNSASSTPARDKEFALVQKVYRELALPGVTTPHYPGSPIYKLRDYNRVLTCWYTGAYMAVRVSCLHGYY